MVNNPYFLADKGIALRTGRDDRLEYTAARKRETRAPEPEGRWYDGYFFTRAGGQGLKHPSVHLCDVMEALKSPHYCLPGNKPDTEVRVRGSVRVVVAPEVNYVVDVQPNY